MVATHPIEKKTIIVAHYDLNILLLCEREALFENGALPCQILGKSWITTVFCHVIGDFPPGGTHFCWKEKESKVTLFGDDWVKF